MSQLFIELYLDEDVDILIANLLRARGFTVTTTQEAAQLGATDAQQLDHAANHSKTFLTHNRADFERLAKEYFAAGRSHYGIIIAARRTPYEMARRLLAILDTVSADEMENQLRYM